MNNSTHDSEEGNDNDSHASAPSTTTNTTATMNSSNSLMNERVKNSYISMLSSCDDQPRENVKGPQLKLRVKVIEE